MTFSVAAFFVDVISCACARSRSRSNQSAFFTADQSARACADSCAHADAFRSFCFTCFAIAPSPALRVRIRREAQHDKADHHDHSDQLESFQTMHRYLLLKMKD